MYQRTRMFSGECLIGQSVRLDGPGIGGVPHSVTFRHSSDWLLDQGAEL